MVNSSINRTLDEDRAVTVKNMNTDISKLHSALTSVKNLTPEGEIIREDLIGLLEFENGTSHQIDALMIERRKKEKAAIRAAAKKAEPKPAQ